MAQAGNRADAREQARARAGRAAPDRMARPGTSGGTRSRRPAAAQLSAVKELLDRDRAAREDMQERDRQQARNRGHPANGRVTLFCYDIPAMGRPKIYRDNAQKQSAYRQRKRRRGPVCISGINPDEWETPANCSPLDAEFRVHAGRGRPALQCEMRPLLSPGQGRSQTIMGRRLLGAIRPMGRRSAAGQRKAKRARPLVQRSFACTGPHRYAMVS